MNPVWHQKKLKEYCEAKGIIITAFSPLGAKGASWGSNLVMDSEILKEIAEEHGKTIAQVTFLSFFQLFEFNFSFKFFPICIRFFIFNIQLSNLLTNIY
jgi:hypothetical protein